MDRIKTHEGKLIVLELFQMKFGNKYLELKKLMKRLLREFLV